MNTKYYRFKKSFIKWLQKKDEISDLDADIYRIAKKLITTSDTKLYIDINTLKYYIKSDRQQIFISIEEKQFKIAYGSANFYDIRVSAVIANKTIDLFRKVQQRRTQRMEDEVLSNVAISIKQIGDKIST